MTSTENIIEPVYVEKVNAPPKFPFKNARKFQSEFVTWVNNEQSHPICVFEAPTGAGKTAAFSYLIKQKSQVVLIYPTNSLLQQQKEVLTNINGISPKIVDSNTLTGSGIERRNKLTEIFGPPYRHNAILTNPDIVQAIIQNKYADPNDRLFRIFDRIDGIIYDEFHFYKPFSTSGILLQIKILNERMKTKNKPADIVLSSATPNQTYLSFIRSELDTRTNKIRAETTNNKTKLKNPSKIRYKTEVTTNKNKIIENKQNISELLKKNVKKEKKNPHIALIFNSAKDSNTFYSFLQKNHKKLYKQTWKDNGYDTKAKNNQKPSNPSILNTTSKGEVGLDYNIDYLLMEKPNQSSAFIQRFGRSGRHKQAQVKIYNCGNLGIPNKTTYDNFLSKYFRNESINYENKIKHLTAIRTATAIISRETSWENINKELYEDLGTVSHHNYWKKFLNSITEDFSSSILGQTPNRAGSKLIDRIKNSLNSIDSLRGNSISVPIEYKIGTRTEQTQYDLIDSIAHYKIKNITDKKVQLANPRDKPNIKISIIGSDNIQDYYEYKYQPVNIDKIKNQINKSNLSEITDVTNEQIEHFFNILSEHTKIPETINTPRYKIKIDHTRSDFPIKNYKKF